MEAKLKDLLLENWLRQRNANQILWKTKNGEQIPINRMSDSHLKNTINMLIQNDEFEKEINVVLDDVY